MSAKIEERVEEMVRGLLTDSPAVELVDVEYVKERDYYLRVYIDKASTSTTARDSASGWRRFSIGRTLFPMPTFWRFRRRGLIVSCARNATLCVSMDASSM